MPPRPKNESLQERRLEQAQRMLDRIRKQEEKARQLVELELKRLEAMRSGQEDQLSSAVGVQPEITSASPTAFQSQYDQFDSTLSNRRLTQDSGDVLSADMLKSPDDNVPSFSYADNDQHWETLRRDPGVKVYISGYYYSSGAQTKQYEYELGSTNIPISRGDMIEVPVHRQGHNDGKFLSGHDRRFVVTDIYTNEKFKPYHDVAW